MDHSDHPDRYDWDDEPTWPARTRRPTRETIPAATLPMSEILANMTPSARPSVTARDPDDEITLDELPKVR